MTFFFASTLYPMQPLVEFDGDELGFYQDDDNVTELPPVQLEEIPTKGG